METRKLHLQLLACTYGPVTDILRLYFETKILNAVTLDFPSFLNDSINKHVIFHEYIPTVPCCECLSSVSIASTAKRGCLVKSQFDVLYCSVVVSSQNHEQKNGVKILKYCLCKYQPVSSISVDALDVDLLCNIFLHCCPLSSISSWLKNIKDARNKIVHAGYSKIDPITFSNIWSCLELAALGVASQIGKSCERMFKQQIDDMLLKSLESLKDTIKASNSSLSEEVISILNDCLPLQNDIKALAESISKVSCQQSAQVVKQEEQNRDIKEISRDTKEMKSMIETMYARFGELVTVSEIRRNVPNQDDTKEQKSEQSNAVTSNPHRGYDSQRHEVVLQIETPSTWDKSKITEKLSKRLEKKSNETEDEISLIKFEFKCLILTASAPDRLVKDRKTMMIAIGSFLKDIFEDCEIDTSIPQTVFINIDINNSASSVEQVTAQHISITKTQKDDRSDDTNENVVICEQCSHKFTCVLCLSKQRRILELEAKLSKKEVDITAIIELDRLKMEAYRNDSDILTETVMNAHAKTCLYNADEVAIMKRETPSVTTIQAYRSMGRKQLWMEIGELINIQLLSCIEFVKYIPGFSELQSHDQIILLKCGSFEFSLVQCCRVYDPIKNSVICGNTFVPLTAFEALDEDEKQLRDSIFHVVSILQSMNLTDTVITLYGALVLMNADCHGLRSLEDVTKLYKNILESLKSEIEKTHASNVLDKLFKLEKTLRNLHAQYIVILNKLKLSSPDISFPDLHDEIFCFKS